MLKKMLMHLGLEWLKFQTLKEFYELPFGEMGKNSSFECQMSEVADVHKLLFPGKESRSGGTSAKSSFLASLNPSRWGRSSSTSAPDRPPPPKDPISLHKPNTSLPNHKEKVRAWIKEQGLSFLLF